MRTKTILIDSEPHKLLVIIDNDYDAQIYAVPLDVYEEHKLWDYQGVEKYELPEEVLDAVDDNKFEQIDAVSVIIV